MGSRKMKFWRSLQTQLSLCLIGILLVTAGIAGTISFRTAFHEVIELQDDQLRQMSALAERHHRSDPADLADLDNRVVDVGARIMIQVLHQGSWGDVEGGSEPLLISPTAPDGLQTFESHEQQWRIFIRTLSDGERIAVSQPTAVRDEVARNAARTTIVPIAVLIPILVVIIMLLVRLMLRPVMRLAQELDRRRDDQLAALDDQRVPSEFAPFTAAINRLLARVARNVEEQKRFVADAAHELRTPLTAISLQAEGLSGLKLEQDARRRVDTLQRGILRARHLVSQLLLLARSQGKITSTQGDVWLASVCQSVLEDHLSFAERKNIEIATEIDMQCIGCGEAVDYATVLRNLVDNAIRYTQDGGRIDIAVRQCGKLVQICVSDNGPGIDESQRERVFVPFYRIPGSDETGSGLGLAIVRTVTQRLGASIVLEQSAPSGGLKVSVTFPSVSLQSPQSSPRSGTTQGHEYAA
jgi:two-component system OmpR family sensor kinase